MMKSYLEHANISVADPKLTIEFLLTAIPEWRVRGQGTYLNDLDEEVEWFHIGDDAFYIAVDNLAKGSALHWTQRFTGLNHLGFAVPNVEELVQRLKQGGYEMDHWGAEHPHRKNVYYQDAHAMQFEFVEYYSPRSEERNDYLL